MTSGNIHTIISSLICMKSYRSNTLPTPRHMITHLDHLEVGDLELASLWIEDGGHDGVQRVAVDDRARIPQLISLSSRCMHEERGRLHL